MQMASGTASGVSRSSDYRPFGYALTCTDTQAVHVGILCGVTVFFDDHIIPVIAVISCCRNRPVMGCINGCACGHRYIHTPVQFFISCIRVLAVSIIA